MTKVEKDFKEWIWKTINLSIIINEKGWGKDKALNDTIKLILSTPHIYGMVRLAYMRERGFPNQSLHFDPKDDTYAWLISGKETITSKYYKDPDEAFLDLWDSFVEYYEKELK